MLSPDLYSDSITNLKQEISRIENRDFNGRYSGFMISLQMN